MYDVAIFENYENFLREHKEDISTASGALKIITDTGMFRAYMESLVDGLEEHTRGTVMAIANRQREMLLTESANVPASSFAFGWTVLSFPILVDIYAEPIVSELMNVYPVGAPTISIPKVEIKASVTTFDSVSGVPTPVVYTLPDNRNSVRPGFITDVVAAGTIHNFYTSLGGGANDIDPEKMIMNRRYTMITQCTVTDSGGANIVQQITIRPDNRSQLLGSFVFTNSGGEDVLCSITGHVNYEAGTAQVNGIFELADGSGPPALATHTLQDVTFSLKFTPTHTMAGRTKVTISTELTDITIDPNEDFLIELTQEEIQDYKSIFKVDLARTLSEAIKRQVLLNKDHELVYFLNASIPDIAGYGASETLDFNNFTLGGGNFTPNSTIDIFKAIVPKISYLMGVIRRNYNMYPSYLLTGLRSAALLRSVQDMMVSVPGLKGELGWSGETAQFLKLKILEGHSMEDDRIFISTKAPNNSLEKSSIIDLIFQPLYIVQEVTDGNARNFVRSRTQVEIARTDGLAHLQLDNLDPYMGTPTGTSNVLP